MDDKIKVCAYCRVSTDKQSQMNSRISQEEYFKREIDNSEDYELTEIYAEEKTGTSFLKRHEFNRMVYDAGLDIDYIKRDGKIINIAYTASTREPKFKYIFVTNTSRLARNLGITQVVEQLSKKGVFIIFKDINKSTENTLDHTLIELLQVLDKSESQDKSRKVRAGNQKGIMRNRLHCNGLLFGYYYNQKENKLEVIPDEGKIIKDIFEMYSVGIGFRRIVKYLEGDGIKTRNGKYFGKSAINHILSNEKYAGLNNRGKYDTGTVFINKLSSAKIKDEYEVQETDRIEPIISKELFYKCQELRMGKVSHSLQRGLYHGISPYKGLIKCGNCESIYHSGTDRGRRYYKCKIKKEQGTKVCNSPNVQYWEIEEAIEHELKEGYINTLKEISDYYIGKLYILQKELENSINKDNTKQVSLLENELKTFLEKRNRLEDLFIDGSIDKDRFNMKKQPLDKKINELEEEIFNLSKGNEEIKAEIDSIKQTQSKLYNLGEEIKTKDDLMNELKFIWVVTYKEDKALTFVYKVYDTIDKLVNKYGLYLRD